MKILIYSLGLPPFRRGGLVNYTVDLASLLESAGNEVTFLYPGKMLLRNSKKLSFRRKRVDFGFNCYEMINPLPVSLTFGNSKDASPFYAEREKSSIRDFIKKISPDVVHVHTIMGLPKEFLEVLREEKINIVFTTHDYYGLCPKMLTYDPISRLKSSKCSYDCMLCSVGPSLGKIRLMQSSTYQNFKESKLIKLLRIKQSKHMEADKKEYQFTLEEAKKRLQLRKYYLKMFSLIDVYHFNSNVAKEQFSKYIPNIEGKVVPLSIKGLKRRELLQKNEKKASPTITFGFLGGIAEKKGFSLIKDVTNDLNQERKLKFELDCAGSNSNDPFFYNSFVNNLGLISRNDIESFYRNIDVLVVPSLWHETFGLVVIEALSYNVPVFCSDTVGAKDLLPPSFVFHSKNELEEMLTNYILSSKLRKKMLAEIQCLNINFDFKKHVSKIQKYFY